MDKKGPENQEADKKKSSRQLDLLCWVLYWKASFLCILRPLSRFHYTLHLHNYKITSRTSKLLEMDTTVLYCTPPLPSATHHHKHWPKTLCYSQMQYSSCIFQNDQAEKILHVSLLVAINHGLITWQKNKTKKHSAYSYLQKHYCRSGLS